MLERLFRKQLKLKNDIKYRETEITVYKHWIEKLQDGWSITEVLEEAGIRTIGVMGYNSYAEMLCHELQKSSIEIKFIIMKRWDVINQDIPIVTLEENLNDPDAIILTDLFKETEQRQILADKGINKTLSLFDILYDRSAL